MRTTLACALVLAAAVLGGAPAAASAASPLDRLSDADLATYHVEAPASLRPPGERFLADLKARDGRVAAAVEEAARYRVHDEATKKFTREKSAVILAYAILWVVVAAFAATLYLRQRRLAATIAELEARLRKETERAA